MAIANLLTGWDNQRMQADQANAAANNQMWNNVLKAGATAAGAYFGGPMGAAVANKAVGSATGSK